MVQNTKRVDRTLIVTSLVCLAPLALSAMVYSRLPETVAIHWGANGQANGWAPRWVAAFVLPSALLILNVVCHLISNSDPQREGHPPVLITLCKWLPAALSLFVTALTLRAALGGEPPVVSAACVFLGAMLMVVGNYLPKTRQNKTLGIKLPWTLRDEDNWNRTHRMAGPLWMLAGAVFILSGFLGQASVYGVIIAFVLLLAPTVYSFVLSRQ